MEQILVSSLMTAGMRTVSKGDSIESIAENMAANRDSCALVAEDGEPIGIITERDIVGFLLRTRDEANLLNRTAGELMTAPVKSIRESESLFDALVVSRADKIRHLPVVGDDGKLTGLVTQSDLSEAHFHIIEQQADLIEQSIRSKTADLERINDELRALSMEDALMEIGNRRSMEVDLAHVHAEAMRYGRVYAVVLLDIDFFKKYNDHYGHAGGDAALKLTADYLKAHVRKSDRVYRYGGEEMLLVLPQTRIADALGLARRLVAGLAGLAEPHAESDFGVLTTSAGVGAAMVGDETFESWETVVEYADRGLYRAKEWGRNQAQWIDEGEVPAEAGLAWDQRRARGESPVPGAH